MRGLSTAITEPTFGHYKIYKEIDEVIGQEDGREQTNQRPYTTDEPSRNCINHDSRQESVCPVKSRSLPVKKESERAGKCCVYEEEDGTHGFGSWKRVYEL